MDEAAQALESETLIPLSLAGRTTKIILAGDHMQVCAAESSNLRSIDVSDVYLEYMYKCSLKLTKIIYNWNNFENIREFILYFFLKCVYQAMFRLGMSDIFFFFFKSGGGALYVLLEHQLYVLFK